MSTKSANSPDHDDIMLLLPWFVNQTLEIDQRSVVLNHIESCKECQSEIEFLTSLSESAQHDAEKSYSAHADIDGSLSNLMNRIDAEHHPINTVMSGPLLLLQKIGNIFKLPVAYPTFQWGATALASVLVAVLGFQLYYGQSADDYSVLSSSENSDTNMRLSVVFNTSVDHNNVQSLIQSTLDEFGQQADIEKSLDDAYIVVISSIANVAELSKLVVSLEEEALITRVDILP